MKTFKVMLVATIIILLSVVCNAQNKFKVDSVVFDVNLNCHSCEKLMMTNLPYEKGVKDVKVDLEKKEITILFRDDKNNIKSLQEAIEKLGYKAKVKDEKASTFEKK
jgi:copper chaperone CopZ